MTVTGAAIPLMGIGFMPLSSALVPLMGMGLQVLAQQILAIVIAVGRPDHGMNVIARRLAGLIFHQGAHRVLMIEFDQDYRTVNAVVEHRIVVHRADPGKVGFIQVLADSLHMHVGLRFGHVTHVGADQFQQLLALGAGQLGARESFVIQYQVVRIGRRHGRIANLFGAERGAGPLTGIQ